MSLLSPKEIEIGGKTFIISKLPATVGREVLFLYPVSNMPKIGDYESSQQVMEKLMSYVAVDSGGNEQTLSTRTLINNHVESAETLLALEKAMFEYNYSFFGNGKASNFFAKLETLAIQKATGMLTTLLGSLSRAGKPPTKS